MSTGGDFVPVTNGTTFSSVNTAQLNVLTGDPSLDGAQFRVQITIPEGCKVVSQAARFSVTSLQYVRADAPAGGNGKSWATAYNDLRLAIVSNSCASELWVAGGTYSSAEPFTVRDGLAIYGGFAGNETNRNQRNWVTNPTRLTRT